MIDHVRPAQLADWFAQAAAEGQPLVLDVREPWELQTASVSALTALSWWPSPWASCPPG